jgi:hypothetical protein
MTDLTAKKSDFITRIVNEAGALVASIDRFKALQDEYTNNGYFDAPGIAIVDEDCIGDNAHMTAALVTSVISSSIAIDTFMVNNFHDDNMSKAKR